MATSTIGKSVSDASSVASAFGASQIVRFLPDWAPGRKLQQTFYKVAESAQADFETNGPLFAAFQVSDEAQRRLADLAFDTLRLRFLRSDYLKDTTASIVRGSTAAFQALATLDGRRLMMDQLHNIFSVIRLYKDVEAPSSLPAAGKYPLEECVEREYALGEFAAIWSVEGLGERYTSAYLKVSDSIRGLLTTGKGAELPDESLLMMHAGMGMAFAKHIIRSINPWSEKDEFAAALRKYIRLCYDNSRPGYAGAAIEALGFVTRLWHRQMLAPVSEHLGRIDVLAFEYFWHGAGRAMYFSPLNMVPGISAFAEATSVPPEGSARLNAIAGVSWSFNLVNIRQPEIAADFLRNRGEEIEGNDAWSMGAFSTLIVAEDMVPNDSLVEAFCGYRPAGDAEAEGAWLKQIGADWSTKVHAYTEILKRHNRLAEVFRYQKLDELVETLKGEAVEGPNPLNE